MRVIASAPRCQLLIFSACVALTAITSWNFVKNPRFLFDFFAFYCGGSVYASGADPYTVEPLRSCQHVLRLSQDTFVLPAPLPGYDLAFFSLIAKLPFPIARVLWETLLAFAFGASVLLLVRLTNLDMPIVFATLFFSEAVPSLFLGQLIPLAAAALAAAMYCLSRERYAYAALFTTLSLIEPHLGLGACVSLFLCAPRARSALLACLGVLGIISFPGRALAVSYIHDILPVHILSETAHEEQLSLTHVVTLLGAQPHTALALGQASYILLLGIGVVCARALAIRTGERAFLIAIPPVFAVIGGPFVHIHHVAVAVPAALLLFARIPRTRPLIGLALMLLAFPCGAYRLLFPLLPVLMIFAMLLADRLFRASLRGQACIAILAACIISAAVIEYVQPMIPKRQFPFVPVHAPAELIWQQYIHEYLTSNETLFFILALPTWAGLFATAFSAIGTATEKKQRSL
jgi:hypothetical protein